MELRRRQKTVRQAGDGINLDTLLDIADRCRNIIFFTGSGISATSGMSMFSTRNGLYERARRKFKVQDGIKLFTYSFYRQRRAEVQAFFAQIYSEAQASRAATGHHALAEVHGLGALRRQYTLNIDGLSEVVGLDTWHHERNPGGCTVEMHGNIRQLVCPSCHAVEPLSRSAINLMKQEQPVPCSACGRDQLRFKVMLYDDGQGDCITPEHVFDLLEEDLEVCDMIVWAGISFQQSASVEYFRHVRHTLATLGRLDAVPQVLVNPSDEPYFNLLSALSNPAELRLLDLRETSDTAFPAMAQRLREAVDRDGPDGPMGQAQAGGLHGQGQAQGRDGPVGRQGLGQGVVVKKEEQGEEGGSGGSDGEPGGRRKGRGRRGPGAGSRPGSAGGEERLVGNGSWAVGGAAGCMVNGVGGAGLGVGIGNGAGAGGDGAGAGGEGGPKRIKLEPLLLAPDAEQLLMALQAQRALQQHAQRQQQRQRQQQQQQEDEERRRWQEAEEERRRREQEARRRQEEQDTFKLQQLQQRQQQQHQHEQQQRQLLLQLLQQQQQQQQFGDTELGRVAHPQNGSTLLHGRSPVRTVTQDGIAGGGGGCGLATGPGALRQDHRADPHQRPNQALEVAGLSGEGLRTGLGTGVGLHGGLRTGMGVESGGGGVPGGSLGPAALPLGRPGAPWQGGELAGVPGGGAGGAAAAGQGQGQGQGVSVLQALLQQLTGQSPSRQVHQQQPQQQLRQLGEGGTPHASPLKAAAGDQALLQQQPQQQQQQELRNGAAPAAGGGGGGGGMSLLHTLLLHRQGLGEHAGVSPASGVSAALQGMSSRGSLGAAALPSTVTGTTAAAGGLAGLLAQQQQQQQQQHQHHPQHQGFVLDLGASAHFASLR